MDASSGRVVNRKPTSSSPVKGKPTSQKSHLAREIREQFSHLKNELSSQQSSNQHLLQEKTLQLKEARKASAACLVTDGKHATEVDGSKLTTKPHVTGDSAAVMQNGHGKSLHSDVKSTNKSLLKMHQSSLGGTFVLDHSSISDLALSAAVCDTISFESSSHDILTRDIGNGVRQSSVTSNSSFQHPSQDLDDVTDSNDGSISGRTWILDGPSVCQSPPIAAESEVDSVDHQEKIAALSKMLKQTLSASSSRQNTASTRIKASNKVNAKEDKESEKQWQLQKKVFDLTAQMSQLDKRLVALKEENETLKKRGEDVKVSEEKIKQLKRRNTDLAAIARKLEERVKQLQQESAKKLKDSASPSQDVSINTSRNSRTVIRDKSKIADDKDKTIDSLREKCQELLRLLGSQQKTFVQYSSDCYSDTSQLELMVKQATKERLQLEKRLADCQNDNTTLEAKLQQMARLEELNRDLQNEVSQMSEELQDKEKMEIELVQRGVEVEMLNKELDEAKHRYASLEKELNDILHKNTELAIANSDMQHQIVELEQMKSQYSVMEAKLQSSEVEAAVAKSEASKLNSLVESLQQQLQAMAEEKIKLNAEKLNALSCASQKQRELDDANQARERREAEYRCKFDMLEGQVVQLQRRCNEQDTDKLRLMDEVCQLKKQHEDQLTLQSAPPPSSNYPVGDKQNNLNQSNLNCCEVVPTEVLTNGHVSPTEHTFSRQFDANTLDDDQNDFNGNLSSHRNTSDEKEGRSNDAESPAHLPEPVRVFVVLYDYDPEQNSPNDQPELELYLRTGEYVFIYGEMDEDGFYEGELIDGQRGLVPSNFISQLNDDDAADLLAMIADQSVNGSSGYLQLALHDGSVNSASFVQGLDTSIDEFDNVVPLDRLSGRKLADPPFSVQIESGPDHGSLIVSWLPVTITSSGTSNGLLVKGYNVYVNDLQVKQLLNPTGDHVLLEYEDLCSLDSPRYVTVRTVTVSGQESADSSKACLSTQMIRDITTELRSVSLQSASETSEVENRVSPIGAAAVVRPVPHLPRVTGFVNPAAMLSELGHTNIHQNVSILADQLRVRQSLADQSNVDEALVCNVGRATSEPPDVSLSDKQLASVRANTVPPLLDTVAPCSVNATGDSVTVQCVVESEVAARRELGDTNWKHLTRSLVAVSNSGDGVSGNVNHRQPVSHELVETDETRLMQATAKRPLNSSTVWNPEPSLANPSFQQSSAYSMTALDRAPLPNYKADISPSNITFGGSGVWRRVQRRDSGLATAPQNVMENVNGDVEAVQPAVGTVNSGTQGELSSIINSQSHNNLQPLNNQALSSSVPSSRLPGGVIMSSLSAPRVGTELAIDAAAAEDVIVTLGHVGSELIDNNAVTSHHLRDDIPDSELIDYSDDGGESLVDSSMCVGAEQVRIFVALFDYDPATMSPNPDAVDVEMPFHEGQLIQVYGDQDADGFYMGECNGRRGLIPSNMVSMVEVDDPDIALQLLRDSSQPALTNGSLSSSRASSRTSGVTQTMSTLSHQGDGTCEDTMRYVVAIYSYNPQELSPNIDADQELAFTRGQVIAIYGDVDDDGFYFGEIDGRCGLVPSNFVQSAQLD